MAFPLFDIGDKVKLNDGYFGGYREAPFIRPEQVYHGSTCLRRQEYEDEGGTVMGINNFEGEYYYAVKFPTETASKDGAHLYNYTQLGFSKEKLTLFKKSKPMIKKLSNFIKKTVDADTQELLKAGLINGDLEPTVEGKSELVQIMWFANLPAIVARAKEINAEAEAEASK